MAGKRALFLISSHSEDHEFARGVAGSTNRELKILDGIHGAAASYVDQDIFIIDVSTEEFLRQFDDEFSQKVGRWTGQIPPELVHLISADDPAWMNVFAELKCFGNFVIPRYGISAEAGAYYGKIINSLASKNGGELEQIVASGSGPFGAPQGKAHTIKLNHSTDKSVVLENIGAFLREQVGLGNRIAELILNAVDELLMNAIYDAPADDQGNQRLSKVPRNTPMPLNGKSCVELRMCCDGERVAFRAIDLFGSLDRIKLIKHLFGTGVEKEVRSDRISAGSGIGLATTFRSGGKSIFLSRRGVRTEVTTTFRLLKSFRDFKGQFKFIMMNTDR